MGKYLAIGKVSKLKNVSIKSLRYYDEIGVFKPAYINHETNYRYYTEDQLPMLDAISTCIELGIPLKKLSSYVINDNFEFQRLLADCKQLAEARIHSIYDSLTTLQSTSETFNQLKLPSGNTKKLAERVVLTSELNDESNISQKILRLLMLAQLLGIEACYPSGIMYQYQGNTYLKLLYITITDTKGNDDPRIKKIPAGNYHYLEMSNRVSEDPKDHYSISDLYNNLIIETDIMEEERKSKGYLYELQYMA